MSGQAFEIGSKKFQLNKINAFKQFHIVRRIAPILADLLPAMKDVQKIQNTDGLSEDKKLDEFAKIATPLMNGISKLSDKDADLVLFGLLSSVQVQQETGNWANVSTETMLMMQDLELPILLQLAGRAFMYNLSGFFGALPHK